MDDIEDDISSEDIPEEVMEMQIEVADAVITPSSMLSKITFRINTSQDGGKTIRTVKRVRKDIIDLHSALSWKYRGTGTIVSSPTWFLSRSPMEKLFNENGNFFILKK